MKKLCLILFAVLLAFSASAQADRREVRAGNRKFRKDKIKEAEIDYRRAVLKDSLSVAGEYNLASSLYRQEDYEGAGNALSKIKNVASSPDYHYNVGDVALQKKDYAAAVEAFRNSLLQNPGDLDAKENYIYAKKMLENQKNNGGGGGGGNQNQNDDKEQDNDRNQDNNDNQGNQDRKDGRQPQPQESGISQQQAQQMLKAIQAKEKETQDKVNKEKAAALKSRQKEKNW